MAERPVQVLDQKIPMSPRPPQVSERCAKRVVGRFVKVESGRKSDRPELAKALDLAKVTSATLVIAKLDRLSRNATFLLTLRDSGVAFLAADMPEANDLTVGIMALVAEQERRAISRRTKEALAAAKARGVRLGNPNGAAALRRCGDDGAALRRTVSQNADAFARDLAPVVEAIRAEVITILRGIADALNDRGIRTRRGGRWWVSNVRGLLARVASHNAATSRPDHGKDGIQVLAAAIIALGDPP